MSRHPTPWIVALVLVSAMLGSAVWWRDAATASRDRASPLTAVAPSPGPGSTAPEPGPVSHPAVEALRDWDGRRAAAFARGSARALRSLYVPGSGAGEADLALLRGYTGRGLRVRGMRMQVLSVEVLAHHRDLWRLRVVDRLTGAVAVGAGVQVPLPRDRPSAHVVTLARRSPGHPWLVASVR